MHLLFGHIQSLLFLIMFTCLNSAVYALETHESTGMEAVDTILPNPDYKTDSIIQLVINPKTERPDGVTAAAVHDLTRFGFRDLFTAFDYNPGIPYSQQINPKAELYMSSYLQKHRPYLLSLKKNGTLYFNLIDNIFKEYGLPVELKYLAVIESGLKTSATSWVGAAGPWQFMPATAQLYGLKVSRHLDERRDYYKSTHAAAKLLLQLYQEYHDWLLVIAAYNGGGGRVNQAIRKSGSSNFWQLQHYLPEESKNHVKKFIATHYIMENKSGPITINHTRELEPELTQAELNNTTIVEVTGRFISSVIIQQLQLDPKEFNRLNPAFDERLEKEGHYAMRLDHQKSLLFKKIKYEILNRCIQELMSPEH